MLYISSFIPNIENAFNLESFDFLFGCQSNEENDLCTIDGNIECPITTQ